MADSTEVATWQRRDVEPLPRFDWDGMEPVWHEYVAKKQQKEELEKWIEEFHRMRQRLAPDAREFYLNGKVVATYDPVDKMQTRQLQKDNPALYEEFVELVTERRFDEEHFKKEHPEIWKQYQSRSFRLK